MMRWTVSEGKRKETFETWWESNFYKTDQPMRDPHWLICKQSWDHQQKKIDKLEEKLKTLMTATENGLHLLPDNYARALIGHAYEKVRAKDD